VFHRACTALAEAGYEVHLLAQGEGRQTYQSKGVFIHPLPSYETRMQRFTRASRVAEMAANLKPDLFHVHEPDLLGPVIARAGSKPVVYDVHESYLDVINVRKWLPTWTKPFARLAWDLWERRLVRRCAGVVVVTERIAARYLRLNQKVRVVANYPDCENMEDGIPISRDPRTCVYAGALSRDRGLSQIFEAMAILNERDTEIRLALAGICSSEDYLCSLLDEAHQLGIGQQVHYHGVLPRSKALRLQRQAGIGLVTYLPLNYSITGLPNKLMECMALGLPVVGSDFPEFRQVAGVNGAAILVDPRKPEQIADAIELLVRDPDLARRMGEAGERAVRERFNWGIERAKLLQLYQQILGPSGYDRSCSNSPCAEPLTQSTS
jgi:glycosyltransferase involved in cell wall biosynthesis